MKLYLNSSGFQPNKSSSIFLLLTSDHLTNPRLMDVPSFWAPIEANKYSEGKQRDYF